MTRRYDYEEVDSDAAAKVIKELESAFASSDFVGSSLSATSSSTSFKVAETGNFTYTDPIDKSVSKNQGLYVTFEDGSRFVVRLSGTGSQGATIRLYVEKYSKDEAEYERDTQEGLKPLIEVALKTSKLVEHTGRKEPTVITVSRSSPASQPSTTCSRFSPRSKSSFSLTRLSRSRPPFVPYSAVQNMANAAVSSTAPQDRGGRIFSSLGHVAAVFGVASR